MMKMKVKNKRWIWAMGAVPLALPLSVISCNSTQTIPKGSIEPNSQTKTLQKLDLDKVAKFSEAAGSATRKISAAAVDSIDRILAMMNSEPSWEWHTIGEPFVDGANAIRYVIWKAANEQGSIGIEESAKRATTSNPHTGVPGRSTNNAAEEELKKIVNELKVPQITDKSSPYVKKSIMDINKWLGASKDDKGNNFTKEFDVPRINNYKTEGSRVYSLEELKDMKPLRLNLDNTAFAQYRAQQLEWRGSFDMHQWKTTNSEMEKASAAQLVNSNGIAAPPLNTTDLWGSENYMFALQATADSAPKATQSGINFTYNIYEGFVSALMTFYDDNNGAGDVNGGLDKQGNDVLNLSSSAGHRVNEFAPGTAKFGYSIVADDSLKQKPYPYMMETFTGGANLKTLEKDASAPDGYKKDVKGQYVYRTVVDDATFDQRKEELQWLKNGLGLSDADFKLLYENLDIESRYLYNSSDKTDVPAVGKYYDIIYNYILKSHTIGGHSLYNFQRAGFEKDFDAAAKKSNNFQGYTQESFLKLIKDTLTKNDCLWPFDSSFKAETGFKAEDINVLTHYKTSVLVKNGFVYNDPNYVIGLYDVLGGKTAFGSLAGAKTISYQEAFDKYLVTK